jgi:hypothetical protein
MGLIPLTFIVTFKKPKKSKSFELLNICCKQQKKVRGVDLPLTFYKLGAPLTMANTYPQKNKIC